jgi:hypothetical protein
MLMIDRGALTKWPEMIIGPILDLQKEVRALTRSSVSDALEATCIDDERLGNALTSRVGAGPI